MKDDALQAHFFPNEEIGRLRLLKLLRVRQRSEVWCGADLEKGSLSAVKFLYPGQFHAEHFSALKDFLQKENSPAIIRVFQTGKTVNSYPYILMEYASKGSLRSWLKRRKRISFAQGVYLVRQMLNALCVLHEHGIVHRDIKPENIWIAGDGSLRLGDFGIARFPGVQEKQGKIFGTARYCSPEQASDSTKVDCRSDLYSLGAVIFEALSGTPLRHEDSFLSAGARQAVPRELLKEFAIPSFTDIIAELLAFSASDRPGTPAAVLERLNSMGLPEQPFCD